MTLSEKENYEKLSPAKRELLKRLRKITRVKDIVQKRISKIERTSPLHLSFAQQRLWFLNRFEEDKNTQYNIPWALRLKGILNINALRAAFQTIVQRHEALRTSFQSVDGVNVQVITDELALDIPIIDAIEEEVPKYVARYASHVFDLTTTPLIKVGLLRLSPAEHVLLINMHHIISDGWSLGVLSHELTTLYTAYINGEASPLPPLPIQYADFAHWQRQWLQGEVLNQQVNYWKQQLKGAPALLELPTDRPRPPAQSYRGNHYSFTLSTTLTQRLRQLSRSEGTTLFMTLLAAFNILLARYSGQQDICIGTPIANRRHQELEGLIGFFVNTLVLRTQLNHTLNFKALLQQVKATALSAYAHQDIPFEHLVEALKPERSLSHAPLFQVMFSLQNAANEGLTLPNITVIPMESDIHTAKFDLTMGLAESDKGMEGVLEYNTDLFDLSTIERLITHYQVLLEGIVENPEQGVYQQPLLTEAEHQQILVDWNDTEVAYPQDQCIHQLFEAQARQTPDAIAVVYENQQLSYEELNKRSNQLAHYLIEQGVGPDIRVGLCLERSLEMVIGILGILKAGGAYLPIDPDYPQQRIEYLLANSNVTLLLTQISLYHAVLKKQNDICFCLDQDWDTVATLSHNNPLTSVNPTNLAYVIYTSGSTGQPKGVMCAHEGLVNRINWMQHAYQLNADDHVLQKTPYSFDVSVWEFLWPLVNGAQLNVARPDGHKDPIYLAEIIQTQFITMLHFVPSMLETFINAVAIDCQNLKRVICSGEALSASLRNKFFSFFSNTELHNLYGPTEASIDVSFWQCHPDPDGHSVPIGRPIANTLLLILDCQFNPSPIGAKGELYIGGVGLARGYLNRSDLTGERFIPDSFNNQPGNRLYKTGDLVRHLTDGNIEYIGRTDHQVKIRGFRIELSEIEHVLTHQPGVHEAIVLPHSRDHEVGDYYLVAYIVGDTKGEHDQVNLRNELLMLLPDYMVPSFFVFLDALPLTPNGKVNRKALPTLDMNVIRENEYATPNTETEQQLVDIWANLLNLPKEEIGIQDDFFKLGGHSLLAIRIVSQIRKILNVEIPLSALFTVKTVHGLATTIEETIYKQKLIEALLYCSENSDKNNMEEITL